MPACPRATAMGPVAPGCPSAPLCRFGKRHDVQRRFEKSSQAREFAMRLDTTAVASPPTPVCTWDAAQSGLKTWHPFRLPIGIDYYKGTSLPCEPNEELGRDDAWLPATHVGGPSRGPTDSGGIWLYYACAHTHACHERAHATRMLAATVHHGRLSLRTVLARPVCGRRRGCSDLLWHMGRTLLVRNRAHAALVAEQLVATLEAREAQADASTRTSATLADLTANPAISERDAAESVGMWVRAYSEGKNALKNAPSRGARAQLVASSKWPPLRGARAWAGANATVADVVGEASRGLYGSCHAPTFSHSGALRACRCTAARAANGTRATAPSRRRMYALTAVCGDKALSLHAEPLLRRLPIDTLVRGARVTDVPPCAPSAAALGSANPRSPPHSLTPRRTSLSYAQSAIAPPLAQLHFERHGSLSLSATATVTATATATF
jgi:hypothetical protein